MTSDSALECCWGIGGLRYLSNSRSASCADGTTLAIAANCSTIAANCSAIAAKSSTIAAKSSIIAAKSSVIAPIWRIRAAKSSANAPIWHIHGAFWVDRGANCYAFAPICCDPPANLLIIRGLRFWTGRCRTTATAEEVAQRVEQTFERIRSTQLELTVDA